MPYVKEYICTILRSPSSPVRVHEICEFDEHAAKEIGSVLSPKGLPIEAANALCEKWTRIGYSRGYPKFGYMMRVELIIATEYSKNKGELVDVLERKN